MDNLAPGSRQHFLKLISHQKQVPSSFGHSLADYIKNADEDELLDAMSAIAHRFRFLRNQLVS